MYSRGVWRYMYEKYTIGSNIGLYLCVKATFCDEIYRRITNGSFRAWIELLPLGEVVRGMNSGGGSPL